MIQLVRRMLAVVFGISGPFLRLGLCDELAQHIHVDALCNVVLTRMHPAARGVLPAELGIAARRGDQEGLNIPLKALFAFVHQITSFFPVTYS